MSVRWVDPHTALECEGVTGWCSTPGCSCACHKPGWGVQKTAVQVKDPWGFAPEPQPLTRDDLVLAAAKAEHQHWLDAYDEYCAWEDLREITRQLYVAGAMAVLDSAFPLVESAEEIDALPQGTVIVSQAGRVQRRELPGGLSEASGTIVGTLKVWAEPGAHETGRKPHRSTSAELAAGGHVWTVVFRTAVAS